MNDLLINILGIARGNRQSSPDVQSHNSVEHDDKQWDKDRGHKHHGRKHDDD
jgi:hypothetical protein